MTAVGGRCFLSPNRHPTPTRHRPVETSHPASSGSSSLVPTMVPSQGLFHEGSRVDLGSAFEVLEPYAGNSHVRFLKGRGP
jgi:hypothetical protein